MSQVPLREWFQDGTGIAREVISADIQRYLGPEATSRPGYSNGIQGFIIRSHKQLTPNQVEDLKRDTKRWKTERDQDKGLDEYKNSATHSDRWGGREEEHESRRYPSHSQTSYGGGGYPPQSRYQEYTTTPQYGHSSQYQSPSYGQPQYNPPTSNEPPRSSSQYQQYPSQPQHSSAPPGYYLASDGQYYPTSSQPASSSYQAPPQPGPNPSSQQYYSQQPGYSQSSQYGQYQGQPRPQPGAPYSGYSQPSGYSQSPYPSSGNQRNSGR